MNTFKKETIITTQKGRKTACQVKKYLHNYRIKSTDYNKREHSFK
jgi:hypothetical protein